MMRTGSNNYLDLQNHYFQHQHLDNIPDSGEHDKDDSGDNHESPVRQSIIITPSLPFAADGSFFSHRTSRPHSFQLSRSQSEACIHVRSLIVPTALLPMATSYLYPTKETIMSIEPTSSRSSPGSPPELTNSKSSKSSSFHSSVSESLSHDLAHFEDITLDDIHGEMYARRNMSENVPEKPRPNSSQKMMAIPNHSALHTRDLTNGRHVQINARIIQPQVGLALPPKQQRRRRNSKAPNSLLTNLNPVKRSRSVSPISPYGDTTSQLSARLSNGSLPRGPEGASHVRRQSWQPVRRKTVKELEAEYDDLDEDLPEDAVIWNVPISPRPPTEREREKSRSPRSSWSSGPSPIEMAKGLGLDFSSGNPMNVNKALPKSPRLSSLPRSVSMTSIPEDYSLNPRSGTKSWDATLSELSAEAQLLTQVLEEHAEEREKDQERQVQSGSPTRRMNTKRSVSSSTIELPPMRKGDIMIDPLPISKEKEKFLTRTRPSWLPPKDPEEEKRHLKEYQKMMAMALDAEKRKAKKQQQDQCERDDTKETLGRVWQQHVMPSWDEKIHEPSTKELWWKGISPRDRGVVWQRAVGNELGLSESSYNLALERAKAAEQRIASFSEQEASQEKEAIWFEAIRHDVKEAFPELKIFQPGGPLHDTLVDVLMAYAMYRSEVGYVYGTHFIAALLILNLSGPCSFITLSNILNRPLPSSLLVKDTTALSQTYTLALTTLEVKLPALHAHLTNPTLALDPAEYLAPLFSSLFASPKFGMDIASRIWDVYVFEGDAVLVQAAVGMLARLEGRLYGGRKECLDVLREDACFDLGRDDEFMACVRGMVM